MFDVVINDIKYEYVKHIEYKNKKYVAYADDENIYISEYYYDNNNLILLGIDDNLVSVISKEMGL